MPISNLPVPSRTEPPSSYRKTLCMQNSQSYFNRRGLVQRILYHTHQTSGCTKPPFTSRLGTYRTLLDTEHQQIRSIHVMGPVHTSSIGTHRSLARFCIPKNKAPALHSGLCIKTMKKGPTSSTNTFSQHKVVCATAKSNLPLATLAGMNT